MLYFKFGVLFTFLFCTSRIFAQVESRLLSQSPTGQTAVFNVGKFDKVFEGDEAVILKNVVPLESKALRVVPVAKARCIKTNSHGSIWILYQISESELLIPGDKFLIMTDTNSLNGQKNPEIGRSTIVSSSNQVEEDVKSFLNDEKDAIAKKSDEYESLGTMHSQEIKSDHDTTMIDVDEWKRSKNLKYRSAIYKSTSKQRFVRSYRLEKFYQLVTDYLNRINDPEFNYEKFFADQMRDASSNEFRNKSYFNSEYENFLYNKSRKSGVEVKLYQSLLKKGEAWSEDFSDEELRQLLGGCFYIAREREANYRSIEDSEILLLF